MYRFRTPITTLSTEKRLKIKKNINLFVYTTKKPKKINISKKKNTQTYSCYTSSKQIHNRLLKGWLVVEQNLK